MSRDKKRQIFWYQVDDGEAIARHLEKMARKGWLLEGVDNWRYRYRRSEPAEVKYAVAFFPDASVFDPGLAEGQETYVEYCQAAGWELAASYGPIQYFRSTRPDPVDIETDEAMKLTAIRRTMRKTFVLSYALLLLLPAMYLPLSWSMFRRDPLEFSSSNLRLSLLLLMAGILLFAGGMLTDYMIWVLRSKHAVARGGACRKPHTRFRLFLSAVMMAVCAVAVLGYLMEAPWLRAVLLAYLVIYAGVLLLAHWVLGKLKQSGTSRGNIKGACFCFVVAAGLVIGVGTPFLTIRLADAGVIRQGRGTEERYTYTGGDFSFTRDVYHDGLPVTLEELGYAVTEEDHCSCKAETGRSPLAVHSEFTQEALNLDSALPGLYYQTYETPWPWLLEQCWEHLTAEQRRLYDGWVLEEPDPGPWGALEACRPEGMCSYLLRYPERIITLRLWNGEVTEEQLADIVRTLRSYPFS